MFSVLFDRTALSLSALTITETPGGSYWLPEEGSEEPRFGRRKEYAPNVRYLGSRTLLSRVNDTGAFPLNVYAGAASGAALDVLKAALETTVDQWEYELTFTLDGVTRTYMAECVDDDIAWGAIDSGMVKAHVARGVFTVPLLYRVS